MIVIAGPLAPPADRLLDALAARGLATTSDPGSLGADVTDVTLAVSDGPFVFNYAGLVAAVAPRRFRTLVLSRLGAHPDARASSLQRLWRLEEHVRKGGAPTLTLRFAPLVAPGSPLVRHLRGRAALPRGGRVLLNPVAESDVVETLVRALEGRAPWNGWYEVAGAEVWSLAELADAARASDGPRTDGAWEPALEEMAEHRLAESEPWASAFGIAPTPVRGALAARAA